MEAVSIRIDSTKANRRPACRRELKLVWLYTHRIMALIAVSQLAVSCKATTQSSVAGPAQIAAAKPVQPEGLVLASPTVAPCPVVFDSTVKTPLAEPLREAAADMVKYLSQITGQKFNVAAASENKSPRAIIIGYADPKAPRPMSEEEFTIKTNGQNLRITAGGGRGIYFAVYWFLERYAGCKWWSYNEEDVPSTPTLRILALDDHEKPAFELHDLFNLEAQSGKGNFLYKSRAKSAISFTGGHTLNPLLIPYAKKNPEFWPMDEKGDRKQNDLHFNYLAPGISDALAEALSGEVEKRDKDVTHFIYQAGMGDWSGGMDMSPASKQMYEAETWTNPDGVKQPGYSAPLLKMINAAATKLAEKYPGIKVGTFAYMSLEAPPATVRPADNVYIWVPRLRHDTVLSIEESDENKPFRRNLEQWAKIAPGRVYVWDYGVSFSNFMAPFPCLRSMAQNIKYYHRIGVKGLMIQGNYVSTGGDLAVLKNYVWRKLLWEPSLDVDTLVRSFCKGYYGPAAGEIIDYVNLMEDSVRKPVQIHADEFDEKRPYLTPELVARLRAVLAQAKAKTVANAGQPFYRRVCEVEASLESFILSPKGTVAERDGRLIRTDISPEKGGEYTFDRAQDQIKYSRNASPREYGAAAGYQLGFLALQGGPLYGIKSGSLEAKVAPRYEKRLWRVTLDGKNAIDGGTVTYVPENPAYIAAAPGFDPDGAPAGGARLDLSGEVGFTDWGFAKSQALGESYELVDDHTLRITGTSKRLVERLPDGFEKIYATVESQYHVEDPGLFVCEAYVDGAWKKLDVGPTARTAPLPATTQLRITRRDRNLLVLDKYSGLAVTGGEVTYDPPTKIFKTLVKLAPAAVPAAKDAVQSTFVREIEVRPLP